MPLTLLLARAHRLFTSQHSPQHRAPTANVTACDSPPVLGPRLCGPYSSPRPARRGPRGRARGRKQVTSSRSESPQSPRGPRGRGGKTERRVSPPHRPRKPGVGLRPGNSGPDRERGPAGIRTLPVTVPERPRGWGGQAGTQARPTALGQSRISPSRGGSPLPAVLALGLRLVSCHLLACPRPSSFGGRHSQSPATARFMPPHRWPQNHLTK